MVKNFDFKNSIKDALNKKEQRANFRKATTLLKKNCSILFENENKELMRRTIQYSKKKVLTKLPELLEKFEKRCKENGINVHWAVSAKEANNIILNIAKKHNVKSVVKGKSMVSEETHLNKFLADNGIEALETDLGEFIIQLNNEPPSHIIVPAVHKNRYEIAKIFEDNLGVPYTDDIQELNAIARKTLREKFKNATMGITGVNFAVANAGAIVLIENEGNGRMCTTIPKVHVAMMGLERIVESFEDISPYIRLLTGSATGQLVTAYTNIISGPRKPDEKDGPEEVHIVIVDNGRSNMYVNPMYRSTLQCIRCGACLNNCPVYVNIGGHAYESVYPGPIGEIVTPHLEGLEAKGELVKASSLCKACSGCPAMIPIPETIRHLREESVGYRNKLPESGCKKSFVEATVWKIWAFIYKTPLVYGLMTDFITLFGKYIPKISLLGIWTKGREKPTFSKKSLHKILKEEEGVRYE